jgi:hypothetical protein
MRSAAAAEWILSLVTEPDRASSTVGDLVEESSPRGALWFWASVWRTAGSHFWRDLSASPLRMAGLAFCGLAACVLAGVGLAMPLLLADLNLSDSTWRIPLVNVLTWTAGPLLGGWSVARRSHGRELPAAFAVSALEAVLYIPGGYLSVVQVSIGRPDPSTCHGFTKLCVFSLFVIAGAVVRRVFGARMEARHRWSRYLG